jgi:membrane protease subunit HflK
MPPTDSARGERLGWVGLLATAALGALALVVAWRTGSFAAWGAALHVLVGVVVWLGSTLLERRRRRAELERLELARLGAQAREGRRALFGADADPLLTPSSDPVAAFLALGVPILTVAVALAEGASAWWLATRFPGPDPTAATLGGAALLCLGAFALLVLGRYGFVLGRAGVTSAAAGGRRATSGALALFLAGLSLAAQQAFRLPVADLLGYAFVAVAGLLGLEALLLLLLEAYRPRSEGETPRPAYDSRLLGLLSAPADLAKTIAHAVDYQFGFALSQTWFYRFLERWVVPLCGFTALAFWLLSTVLVVQPHEQALVRRLGKLAPPRGPGFHLVLPWPLDQVQRVESSRLHSLQTGGHGDDDEHGDDHDHHDHEDERESVLVWNESGHVDADHDDVLLLIAREQDGDDGTTPVNLLGASATIHYEVKDLASFARGVEDPHALLTALAERELSFLLSGADMDQLLRDRGEQARELGERLQAAADAHGLGLKIVHASLTDLHPPVEIGSAFEEVTVALEESHAQVLAAEIDAARLLPRSRVDAQRKVLEAALASRRKVALARADAARFAALADLDGKAPSLWRLSRLLDRLAAGAADRRKVVLGRPGAALTQLDLQEKVSAADIGLGEQVYEPTGGADDAQERD